jgi:hypothetical protein
VKVGALTTTITPPPVGLSTGKFASFPPVIFLCKDFLAVQKNTRL